MTPRTKELEVRRPGAAAVVAACVASIAICGATRAQTVEQSEASAPAKVPGGAEPDHPPSLADRALALWSRASEGGGRASAWVRANLTQERAAELIRDVKGAARERFDKALGEAQARHDSEMGLRYFNGKSLSLGNEAWSREAPPTVANCADPRRLVVLVHGLDEPGDVWNDLTPYLATAGYRVARFDYENDGPIGVAAEHLCASLRDLRAAGVSSVDLVCHSMGGLVARDTLTRPGMYAGDAAGHADLPDVARCVMVGTPNMGSSWARIEFLAEARDQFQRWMDAEKSDAGHLIGWLVDGRGQAADDLLPGSAYLTELNSRPLPRHVRITAVAGRATPFTAEDAKAVLDSRFVRALLSEKEIAETEKAVSRAIDDLGDGPVPVDSARLPGVEDFVEVESAHQAMFRRLTLTALIKSVSKGEIQVPPAIPIVMDRLAH